jgi:hypothetical protein
MKSRKFSVSLFRLFTACLVCIVVQGCAISLKKANHGFGFTTRDLSPAIIVLEYRYGEKGRRNMPEDGPVTNVSVIGDMSIPEFIYIRWRRLDTGETLTRTMNLRGLLPEEMDNKYIYLTFSGSNVEVFLEDRNRVRPPSEPIVGRHKSPTYVTTQIFYTN